MRQALGVAWSRRRQILGWSALSMIVGAVIRTLERFGVGGLIGALTLNIGWAAATVFAMPMVIVDGTMPLETLRRSSRMLKDNFGTTVFSNIRLALPWMVGMFVVLVAFVLTATGVALGIAHLARRHSRAIPT